MPPRKSRWALPQPRSIVARITLTFVVTGFVLTVATAYLTERFLRNHLETTTSATLTHYARQIALKYSRDRAERPDALRRLAASELLSAGRGTLEARRDFLEKGREALGLAWLGFVNLDGQVVAASGSHLEGKSMEQASWFADGRNGLHIGRDLPNPELASAIEDGTRFVAMSVPVKDAGGQVIGVLGAQQYLNFDPQESPLPLGVAREGIIASIYSSDDRRWLLSSAGASGKAPLPAPITNLKFLGWRETHGGVDYLMGFARSGSYRGQPVPGPVWLVAVRQAAEQAYAPALELRKRLLGWGGGLTLLFAIPMAMFARKLSRKLRAVTASAERIQSGETLAVMPIFPGDDELAKMSSSVNALVEQLRPRESLPVLARDEAVAVADGPTEYVRPAGKDPRRVAW